MLIWIVWRTLTPPFDLVSPPFCLLCARSRCSTCLCVSTQHIPRLRRHSSSTSVGFGNYSIRCVIDLKSDRRKRFVHGRINCDAHRLLQRCALRRYRTVLQRLQLGSWLTLGHGWRDHLIHRCLFHCSDCTGCQFVSVSHTDCAPWRIRWQTDRRHRIL